MKKNTDKKILAKRIKVNLKLRRKWNDNLLYIINNKK